MAKEKVNYQEVYDLYQLCCETKDLREFLYTLDASLGSSDISSLILSHRRKMPFRKSGPGGTAQGSQGADNRQSLQQSNRENGSETARR